ncbi:MAG: tail fiber domain-containing protein [Bacteroidota bacterium]
MSIPTLRVCLRALAMLYFLIAGAALVAQAPSGFRFQAVARDAMNDVLATENVAVRVSLLQGGPSGAVAYSERHEVTTTDLGVFDLHIGNGVGLSGNINTINWGSDSYFLKIDLDPAGGTNYINMGSSQLLSVPYALYAKESGSGGGGANPTDELQNLVYDPATQVLTITDGNSVTLQVGGGGGGTDDQTLTLSGTTLSIEDGNSVNLSGIQDGTEDADADPNNEIQDLSFNAATSELSISGGNSVTIPTGGTDADADPTNEIQELSLSGTTLSIEDGNSVNLSGLQDGTEDADADPTNEIQNLSFNAASNELSIAGGNSVDLNSLAGGSTSLWTESGGNIYRATGRVGIATATPEAGMGLHIASDVLLQTNAGALHLGFPNNGNRWRMSTTNSGADLLFRSKPSGTAAYNTRFAFRQGGEFQLGTSGTPTAWAEINANSNINKPQLKLTEVGNDFARLELTNTSAGGDYWHVAGLPATSAASARLNLYYHDGAVGRDFFTVTGTGRVGVYGTPTARLELFQRGQQVGTGLRFDDGTANQDWDITHGFSLRFHYGGALRGFINANTGAYTVSSDASLKTNVSNLLPVLAKVSALRPTTYSYKSDATNEMTVGFLAQEVQEIFPELVSYSKADKLYGINYAGFGVIAVKAIQEQQEVIAEQAERIDNLEARLARLEALLDKK